MLFAAACGGSDSKSTTTPSSSPASVSTQPAGGASSTAPARTGVDRLNVVAKDFAFTADLKSVRKGSPGTDVSFKNDGPSAHTLTFYNDATFETKLADSSQVAPGQSVAFAFIPPDGATSMYYRCEIHPTQMKGEIAVQ